MIELINNVPKLTLLLAQYSLFWQMVENLYLEVTQN